MQYLKSVRTMSQTPDWCMQGTAWCSLLITRPASIGHQNKSANLFASEFCMMRVPSCINHGEALRDFKRDAATGNRAEHKQMPLILNSIKISNTPGFHGNSIQAAVCSERLLSAQLAVGPRPTFKHGVSLWFHFFIVSLAASLVPSAYVRRASDVYLRCLLSLSQ